MSVGFLTPQNETILLNYWEVSEFCKKIAENYPEDFKKFAKKYHYYQPYFDFVCQKLGYLFKEPLYIANTYLVFKDNAYYLVKSDIENYETIFSKKTFVDGGFSFMTSCSNTELKLGMATIFDIPLALIDPQKVHILSKTGTYRGDGSHSVTANTILSQILIADKKVCEHLLQIYPENELFFALKYLIDYFGFVHSDPKSKYMLCNKDSLTKVMEEYLQELENNYGFECVSYGKKYDLNFSEDYNSSFKNRR